MGEFFTKFDPSNNIPRYLCKKYETMFYIKQHKMDKQLGPTY